MVAVIPADTETIARFGREHRLDTESLQGVVVQENGTTVGYAFFQITDQLEVLAVTSPVEWQDLLVRSVLHIGRLKGLSTARFHCPLPAVFPGRSTWVDTPGAAGAYTADAVHTDNTGQTTDAPDTSGGFFAVSIPEFFEKSGCKTLQ